MSHTAETDVLVTNRCVGGGRTLAENVLHRNTLVQQLIQFRNAQLTGRDLKKDGNILMGSEVPGHL